MTSNNPANFANLPKEQLRELAAKGGRASHDASGPSASDDQAGRHADGTFIQGSELARELGAQGGHVTHKHRIEKEGRNPDGTFKEGSKLAQELGAQGGHAAHEH